MADQVEASRNSSPPWLPFKTLLNFIEWLGEVGVPQRIERNFWAKKLAGNMGPLVINALQFFGLLDDNSYSTQWLDEIAQNPEKRKEFFARQLNEKYGAILQAVNLERATRNQVAEQFAQVFNARGSVLTKAVIFFVHMARFSGASVSNHIIIRERKESARPRKKKLGERDVSRENMMQPPAPPPADTAYNSDRAEAQESLLLWGLFKRLPKPQSTWAKEERQRWLETLQNVLALEYKE